MKIIIPYDSKWSVSLMDHETKENKFKSLDFLKQEVKNEPNTVDSSDTYETLMFKINKNYKNFDYRPISESTVLGIVARLLGEIRYMSEALKDEDHIIHKLKNKITFGFQKRDMYNEIMTLHTPLKDSQSNGQGVITKNKDSLFLHHNDFSSVIYSILNITDISHLEKITDMLKNNTNEKTVLLYLKNNNYLETDISLSNFVQKFERFKKRFDYLEKNYKKNIAGLNYDLLQYNQYIDILQNLSLTNFINVNNKFITNVPNRVLAGILVYSVANWLINIGCNVEDIETKVFNKSRNIPGIASLTAEKTPGGFTIKDFYNAFAQKKTTHTSPYVFSIEFFKKTGEKNTFNTKNKLGVGKEDGVLEINIDVTREEAIALKEQIEDAAVSTFQMGKKGLAYVKRIEL